MGNRSIKIKYLKTSDFRAVLATGVYGGITANGLINANFFLDRSLIPDYQTVTISEDGVPQGMPQDVKDADVVREFQTGILMDIGTAKIIVGWLKTKIEEWEKIPKWKDESGAAG